MEILDELFVAVTVDRVPAGLGHRRWPRAREEVLATDGAIGVERFLHMSNITTLRWRSNITPSTAKE